MKFLYVDESGLREEDRFLVFFGVLVDGYRLKKTMREVRPRLDALSEAYPNDLRELKSSRLVNGRGAWGRVDAEDRKRLFSDLCGFVSVAGAHGYTYVLDKTVFADRRDAGELPVWTSTPWLTGATALSMLVQRDHQRLTNNKGLTVVIFDDNKQELPKLSDFLLASSCDVDVYYERKRRAEPFDQIIDTAFAIKSDHSRLVQIADACAYAIRRLAELHHGGEEAWPGEAGLFQIVVGLFSDRMKFPARTWVPNPHCDAARLIKELGIPNLNRWIQA